MQEFHLTRQDFNNFLGQIRLERLWWYKMNDLYVFAVNSRILFTTVDVEVKKIKRSKLSPKQLRLR